MYHFLSKRLDLYLVLGIYNHFLYKIRYKYTHICYFWFDIRTKTNYNKFDIFYINKAIKKEDAFFTLKR